MQLVASINGWDIYHRPEDKKRPYTTSMYVGGIMGEIVWGFETLAKAKKFAKTQKKG
jgi:hypothetical protein